MQHILITGGTGFFGKSILDYRLRHPDFLADAKITVLSRHPDAFIAANPALANQPGLSFLAGDVRTFSTTNFTNFTNSEGTGTCKTTHSCNSCNSWTNASPPRFDTIIHAATPAVTTLSDDEMYSTIVDGTRNILSLAKSCGATRLLFTSSGAVYGPQTAAASEDTPTNPTTAYGRGKLAAEQLCIDSGIPTKIARCFAFTGPYLNRRIHFAIGNFIQNCLDNEPIVIKGDGTPLRSYLYADDLVEWLFAILDRGEPGRPYNVGSPHALSIRELAETVRSTLGTQNSIQILVNNQTIKQSNNQTIRPSTYVPITTRAESELGLRVTVPLADAIRKSAAIR